MKKKILVTGCAGFIGFHLTNSLCKDSYSVIGIDNLNNYYDVSLKKIRLKILKQKFKKNFKFIKLDISSKYLENIFKKYKFSIVINLAAQAGVRFSVSNPESYLKSNINGFYNILEKSKNFNVKHFIYASSSSVYGHNKKFPYKENSTTDSPLSFYAATKKTNEIIAHSFSNIYKLPTTGLRFFTVYGPYGRPDMSLYNFVKSNFENKKIQLFNYGKHKRDFTYIDDAVNYTKSILNKPSRLNIPFSLFNISNKKPASLMTYVKNIEEITGNKFKIKLVPFQKGDMEITYGDNKNIKKYIKKIKYTNLKRGLQKYIEWYRSFYLK
ncbi:GDP-mannose 4,6-dehydratase [Pelagibacterales bacterium SAG-MED14]|nr:GDP-mannose 4,6-dehydratase [Pelagibacterales bacterium SAG-MED14]